MDWLSPPSAGECVRQSNLMQMQDEPSYPNRRVRVSLNSPFLQSCLASTVHLDDDPKSSTVQPRYVNDGESQPIMRLELLLMKVTI